MSFFTLRLQDIVDMYKSIKKFINDDINIEWYEVVDKNTFISCLKKLGTDIVVVAKTTTMLENIEINNESEKEVFVDIIQRSGTNGFIVVPFKDNQADINKTRFFGTNNLDSVFVKLLEDNKFTKINLSSGEMQNLYNL